MWKRGGVSLGYWGMAGLGYQWGKKEPKLRPVGESVLQKSARESGEVAEIDILARIIQHMHAGKWLAALCTWTVYIGCAAHYINYYLCF